MEEDRTSPKLPQYAPPVPVANPPPLTHSPGILNKLINNRLKSGKTKTPARAKRSSQGRGIKADQNVHITHRKLFN